MNELNSIDVLFSHREYGAAELAVRFRDRVDGPRLKSSLGQVSELYPILSARLEYGERTRFVPSGEISFDEVDLSASDMSLEQSTELAKWVPRVKSGSEQLLSIRLLRTLNADFLLISFAHVLGDGHSLFQWLSTWGQAYGGKFLTPWETDRSLISTARLAASASAEPMALKDLGFTGRGEYRSFDNSELERSPLRLIPDSEIKEIRSRDAEVSRFDAISAWILREKAREIPQAQIVFICPMNLRFVLPEIPIYYFGNAVKAELAWFDRERLLTDDLADIAREIRDLKRRMTPERVAQGLKTLDALRETEGDDALRELRVTEEASVLITDLTKIPQTIPFGETVVNGVVMLSNYPRAVALVPSRDGLAYQVCRFVGKT